MAREATKLVIGRGEVYFDRFLTGTRVGEGERYLGNTPSFRIQREIERLERATSYRGRRITQPGAIISESHTVNLTCEHVDVDNLALWFGTDFDTGYVPVAENYTETLTVKRGRYYQLGKTMDPIHGLRDIDYIEVFRGGVVVPPTGNYEFDPTTGRLYIEASAPAIPTGTQIVAQFDIRPRTTNFMINNAESIFGALRFVSWNEGVRNRSRVDFFFPFVEITPRGQTDLKGDEFQQWGFDITAMNLRPGVPQVYIQRAALDAGYTLEEQAIVDDSGSLKPFTMHEYFFDHNVNNEWPRAVGYPELQNLKDAGAILVGGSSLATFPAREDALDININQEWPEAIDREDI